MTNRNNSFEKPVPDRGATPTASRSLQEIGKNGTHRRPERRGDSSR